MSCPAEYLDPVQDSRTEVHVPGSLDLRIAESLSAHVNSIYLIRLALQEAGTSVWRRQFSNIPVRVLLVSIVSHQRRLHQY